MTHFQWQIAAVVLGACVALAILWIGRRKVVIHPERDHPGLGIGRSPWPEGFPDE
jgi:hypothetical protein